MTKVGVRNARLGIAACAAALLFAIVFAGGPATAFADDQAVDATATATATVQDATAPAQQTQQADVLPATEDSSTGAGSASGTEATSGEGQQPIANATGDDDSGSDGGDEGKDSSGNAAAAEDVPASAAGAEGGQASVEASAEGASEETASQPDSADTQLTSEEASQAASVSYKTHLQTYGWQAAVADGTTSGKDGKRLEAVQISVDSDVAGGVQYSVYVQGKGWQKAVSNGATAGTTGKSLNLQAVRVKLTGSLASLYDVFYRVCIADAGWMDWASNYAIAGTTGFNRQIEKLQVELLEKGSSAPDSPDTIIPAAYVGPASVSVQAHVQNKGWMRAVGNGKVAGTTGKSLRMEAVKVTVTSKYASGGTSTSAHVQNKGWMRAVGNGKVAGTTGKSLRMEALTTVLTGNLDDCYDVFYRVHSQDYGWLDWVCAGDVAGTTGKSKRAEAVQVYVTLRGGTAPDGITRESNGTYFYLDAGHGYSNPQPYDVGATGSGYKEADLTKQLVNKVAYYATKNYGLKVFDNTTEGKAGVNYSLRQDDAKKRGCTAFVSIHFNAGGGTGSESYASKKYGASGSKLLQSIMHGYLVKGTGLTDRGQKDYGWSVCCGSVPSTLLEVCFIDNSSDMKECKSREDYLARQLAAGLYKASKSGF